MTHNITCALLLVIAAASGTLAQDKGDVIYQTTGQVAIADGAFHKASGPVVGAPYSATITNESVQTLADGNRIVQTSTGNAARFARAHASRYSAAPDRQPVGGQCAPFGFHSRPRRADFLQLESDG